MLRLLLSFTAAAMLTTQAIGQSAADVATARLAYIDGDYATSLAVLRPAAEAGDPVAQNVMGAAYDDGNGVPQDFVLAQQWYERAAAQDFAKSLHNLGLWYVEGRPGVPQDYAKAIGYYDRAAALDYDHAINKRGRMHELGQGGEIDLEAAAELYQQAVDLGNHNAMSNLGRFYVRGDGVEEDMGYALQLFRQGAAAGNLSSMSNLGAMYKNGYGVGQDNLAAMALYRMAAERGYADGAVNLAYELIEGEEGWRDPAAGYGWCLAGMAWDSNNQDLAEDCTYLAEQISAEDRTSGEAKAAELTR